MHTETAQPTQRDSDADTSNKLQSGSRKARYHSFRETRRKSHVPCRYIRDADEIWAIQ